MPPKVMFTREEIIAAALDVVREIGASGLTARSLAAKLGCSPKPVFGLFKSMDEVQSGVLEAANALYEKRMEEELSAGRFPPYKCTGMAYIRFALEEKELFKLLFMRDRKGEDQRERGQTDKLVDIICAATGLSRESAYLFHLEMWVFVHGIATMLATDYLKWDEGFIENSLTDCYMGLMQRFRDKGKIDGNG